MLINLNGIHKVGQHIGPIAFIRLVELNGIINKIGQLIIIICSVVAPKVS